MSSFEVQETASCERAFDYGARPLPQKARARRRPHFDVVLERLEVVADLLTIILAVLTSYGIYVELDLGKQARYGPETLLSAALGFAVIYVLMLHRDGAYRPGNSLLRVRETERILRVSLQAFLAAFGVSLLASTLLPRLVVGIACIAVPAFLMLERHLFYLCIRALHARGFCVRKVLIYGAGYSGRRIFSALARSPKLGLEPAALVDDDPQLAGSVIYASAYQRERSAPVLAGPLTEKLIREQGATVVVIAIPKLGREKFASAVLASRTAGAELSFAPPEYGPTEGWIEYTDIDGLMIASLSSPGHVEGYDVVKRIFDFLGAAVLLVLTAPLQLLIAMAIRATSPGPALFMQERVGQGGGRRFRLYKFRTMHREAPAYAYSPEESADPRITPIGRFLRRTSLDELPQLWNVLKGEMSLVGPRPEMPFIVAQYSDLQRQRLLVKPGITGLWQLSADRRFLIHENIEYDLYYVRHRSFFMDLSILVHTVFFAMRGV